MTADILTIPATSTEVERLFNQARDLITYRRSKMTIAIVSDIMLIKHVDASELEQEYESKKLKEKRVQYLKKQAQDNKDLDFQLNVQEDLTYISDAKKIEKFTNVEIEEDKLNFVYFFVLSLI